MMTGTDFESMKAAHEAGEAMTQEQAKMLIDTVSRLDMMLYVFQTALQLMSDNINTIIPEMAQNIQRRCGRTDKKVTRDIAEMAATAVSVNDEKINGYIVTSFMAIAEALKIDLAELITGDEPEEATSSQPSSQEHVA